MDSRWDKAVTALLVIGALITTTVVVRRELMLDTAAAAVGAKPTYLKNWKDIAQDGVRSGSAAAPVQIIEFADFECPFCAQFHNYLKTLDERLPGKISTIFVHLPLAMHRFALPAAQAAECAGEQQRFRPMRDQLMENQEKFGIDSWAEIATRAGVPDLPAFEQCMQRSKVASRIESGKARAKQLNIAATPTIILNGWKLGAADPEKLDEMIDRVLAGKDPI